MRSENEKPTNRLDHLIGTLFEYKNLILVPTILCTLCALAYATFRAKTYSAKQAIMIRDDLLGQSYKPGKFDSLDMMKSAQETVLEISRKPDVIRRTLAKLGPPTAMSSIGWPSDNFDEPLTRAQEKIIEDTQGAISFSAPNGAEFGKTEVILLNGRGTTRVRAARFLELLLDEVDKKIREVRSIRLRSMESELRQSADQAMFQLEQAAAELNELEKVVGADLGTLRLLSVDQSSEGGLQRSLSQVQQEKRVAVALVDKAISQRDLLFSGVRDPEDILATSNELLEMQPILKQLKTGLINAELALSSAVSRYEAQHPLVVSAKLTVKDIKQQINNQLPTVIKGLDSQIKTLIADAERLKKEEEKHLARLGAVSSKRVPYSKLNEEVRKKSEVYNKAASELAMVRSLGNGAGEINLVTRVDSPQVSTRPDGPGRRILVLGGFLGGSLIGLLLVSLVAPPFEGDGGFSLAGGTDYFTGATNIARKSNNDVAAAQSQSDSGAGSRPDPIYTPDMSQRKRIESDDPDSEFTAEERAMIRKRRAEETERALQQAKEKLGVKNEVVEHPLKAELESQGSSATAMLNAEMLESPRTETVPSEMAKGFTSEPEIVDVTEPVPYQSQSELAQPVAQSAPAQQESSPPPQQVETIPEPPPSLENIMEKIELTSSSNEPFPVEDTLAPLETSSPSTGTPPTPQPLENKYTLPDPSAMVSQKVPGVESSQGDNQEPEESLKAPSTADIIKALQKQNPTPVLVDDSIPSRKIESAESMNSDLSNAPDYFGISASSLAEKVEVQSQAQSSEQVSGRVPTKTVVIREKAETEFNDPTESVTQIELGNSIATREVTADQLPLQPTKRENVRPVDIAKSETANNESSVGESDSKSPSVNQSAPIDQQIEKLSNSLSDFYKRKK